MSHDTRAGSAGAATFVGPSGWTSPRRAELLSVARTLFAEHGFEAVRVSDIARAAAVSSQTVFNHFRTKEELFFEGRTAWGDGPADAVRMRAADTDPITSLRDHLHRMAMDTIRFEATPEGRAYAVAIHESPALGAYERGLVHHAEQRLAVALTEAWAAPRTAEPISTWPADPATAATITAATWLAAVRVLIEGPRCRPLADGEPAATLSTRIGTTLDRLSGMTQALRGLPPS